MPHIPPHEYPGQALACALYLEGGIRSCEIGSVMFGRRKDGGAFLPAKLELVRLALPRRVYTQSHIDRIIEICGAVAARSVAIRGIKMTYAPAYLRHFTAEFQSIAEAYPGTFDPRPDGS